MSDKFMRILVFFDLPVKRKKERKVYTHFRKFLEKDGYDMIQYSVYSRICNGKDNVDKHIGRLKYEIPKKGSVRSMVITDKQYGNMIIHVGKKTAIERKITSDQLVIF